ncbi:MAG: VOC family protein [Actinomycetota bacterium]|jgi:catechol 2,3-dioxygenase-like lactoylglutathione lyase family enzyme|nr:VOC family protein [Actinomycetota bacterium]
MTGTGVVSGSLRLDHVGISVPDLDAAITFFIDGFGAQVVFRMDRPAAPGPVGAHRLGAPADAQFALAMLSLGDGRLELLQWWAAAARGDLPPIESPGGSHVAVEVADVGEALARLARLDGVAVLSQPLTFEHDPTPGLTNAFVRAPWGALIELLSW